MIKKIGSEPFTVNNEPLPLTLLHFWQWSSSDLLSNTLRGRLAEYIVATALDIAHDTRMEWAPYDLHYSGLNIEVKSSAYIQSWFQNKPSRISFGIQPTMAWDATTNTFDPSQKRQAHLYIFSLLEELNKEQVNPLNLSQWKFYLVTTKDLDNSCGTSKSISLKALKMLRHTETDYSGLKAAVEDKRRCC